MAGFYFNRYQIIKSLLNDGMAKTYKIVFGLVSTACFGQYVKPKFYNLVQSQERVIVGSFDLSSLRLLLVIFRICWYWNEVRSCR